MAEVDLCSWYLAYSIFAILHGVSIGNSARHSILQRPVMFFCPESVLLDIFIGDFDEDKESIFMKLGDSA